MRVMAKAYRGRPLDRFAIAKLDDDHVAVSISSNPGNDCIGFPLRAVFDFDPAIMRSLEAAWEAGDSKRLDACWAKARPVRADNIG